jgi:hypothetical protein
VSVTLSELGDGFLPLPGAVREITDRIEAQDHTIRDEPPACFIPAGVRDRLEQAWDRGVIRIGVHRRYASNGAILADGHADLDFVDLAAGPGATLVSVVPALNDPMVRMILSGDPGAGRVAGHSRTALGVEQLLGARFDPRDVRDGLDLLDRYGSWAVLERKTPAGDAGENPLARLRPVMEAIAQTMPGYAAYARACAVDDVTAFTVDQHARLDLAVADLTERYARVSRLVRPVRFEVGFQNLLTVEVPAGDEFQVTCLLGLPTEAGMPVTLHSGRSVSEMRLLAV